MRALGNGVCQHGGGVVSAHAPVVVGHVTPDGKQSVDALLLVANHGHGHVSCSSGLHQHEEGVFGAIGVPKREYGVVLESSCAVDVLVQSAVSAIHVHVDGGVDHGVVVRGIEHCLLVFGAFHLYGGELAVPIV